MLLVPTVGRFHGDVVNDRAATGRIEYKVVLSIHSGADDDTIVLDRERGGPANDFEGECHHNAAIRLVRVSVYPPWLFKVQRSFANRGGRLRRRRW